ncbi:MAG: DUF348 domain-containing protein [Ruminococcaceae bacterium]|nr:DUF348 domain-containing protein [Oscillospiraceae bacterium]
MFNGLKDSLRKVSSPARRNILISSIFVLLSVSVVCTTLLTCKHITIVDGECSEKEIVTFKKNVEDVLKAEGFVLGTSDKLSVDMKSSLENNMTIQIYRAYPVSITEKGKTTQHMATRRIVRDVLAELGYEAKETDKITPALDKKVSDFDEIVLVHLTEKVIEAIEEIPYESTERKNNTLASGTRKVVQRGKPGEKTVSYKVFYEDGVEVRRETVEEKVVTEAIAQITEIGTKQSISSVKKTAPSPSTKVAQATAAVKTSRSGNLSYSRVIPMNATAYDASSCGKSPSHPAYGITATGMRAGYGVVAVDPRVIPLGSKLYIESADGSYIYGSAVAADTGGAIKGNRIDLCFNSRSEAISFGRRQVKVYILN